MVKARLKTDYNGVRRRGKIRWNQAKRDRIKLKLKVKRPVK